ncbi:Bestrophin, RFP-TM, chloride channel-domain-containing protein [Crucibulum laeve]|uniref:Bestrophin, RFP-TM, chloride channel-domain-containing protein n=1 Tax=Crucibulum laeve TaxID=68775 RepID=A0A5C3LNM6_9AGAR|nr:Bestrophin, RFP-TM, chloride channel-domain-containing protein [Crucibulum laeve]
MPFQHQSSNGQPTSASTIASFNLTHKGFRRPDPFAKKRSTFSSFIQSLLATALFRCWHIILFFACWSTMITVLNHKGNKLTFQPTLLTVVGTVLGFCVSYRTTSSFERYNEGRRLWSQIILATRTFSRTVWFHVPDPEPTGDVSSEEIRARSLIEKKTVINLLEAYAVAVKHYLRGEDGIYYQDLYYLVKFLPAYALPHGMPSPGAESDGSQSTLTSPTSPSFPDPQSLPNPHNARGSNYNGQSTNSFRDRLNRASSPGLPPPVTHHGMSQHHQQKPNNRNNRNNNNSRHNQSKNNHPFRGEKEKQERIVLPRRDEVYLLPAHLPPKAGIFDLFPLSLLVPLLTKKGKELKGKKAARLRAKMRDSSVSHNLPLELSLYLSSYIAMLQRKKSCDVPTTNGLVAALGQLVEALTSLERILTTPIPFSYSVHLWTVVIIYNIMLPFQIWATMKWLTIPASMILSFFFFGFLSAGEEIENPFGYDKNDLNLDHFTNNVIRHELMAVTSAPPPNPDIWAFSPENNLLFTSDIEDRTAPEGWVKAGPSEIRHALSKMPF